MLGGGGSRRVGRCSLIMPTDFDLPADGLTRQNPIAQNALNSLHERALIVVVNRRLRGQFVSDTVQIAQKNIDKLLPAI